MGRKAKSAIAKPKNQVQSEMEVEEMDPLIAKLTKLPIFYTMGEDNFEEKMAMVIVKHKYSLTEDEQIQLEFLNAASRFCLIQEGLITEEEAENNLYFHDEQNHDAIFPIPIAKIEEAERVYLDQRRRKRKKQKGAKAA